MLFKSYVVRYLVILKATRSAVVTVVNKYYVKTGFSEQVRRTTNTIFTRFLFPVHEAFEVNYLELVIAEWRRQNTFGSSVRDLWPVSITLYSLPLACLNHFH